MGLHCRSVNDDCPFDVSGFTFSGLPGVVIGHNRDIAWGMTNLDPDVSDLYLEKVTGKTYLYDGQQVPLTERDEVIRIAGQRLEADHGALDPARPAALRRLGRALQRRRQRPGRRRRTRPRQRVRRRAGVDGADPAADGGRDLRVRRGVELDRVPRGRALVRRTQPEPRVRRPRRQHRLPGAGGGADPQGRPRRRLPGGRAGCRRTTGPAATCPSTRCRTCSTRPRGSS